MEAPLSPCACSLPSSVLYVNHFWQEQAHEAVRRGYKWVRPINPAERLQDELLRSVGLDPASGGVFCDRAPTRRLREGEDPLPALTRAISSLQRGDELCIPFPQCFAHTEVEAMRRMAIIAKFNASLYVISLDLRVSLAPDMAPALNFLAERAAPFKKQKMQIAQQKRAAEQRAALLRAIRRVKPTWSDPDKTVTDVERERGVSRSNLHRWVRMGLLPPKPRKGSAPRSCRSGCGRRCSVGSAPATPSGC